MRQMTAPEEELERKDKERMVKLRTFGNICLTGELFKQEMFPEIIAQFIVKLLLGNDDKTFPDEVNVEAVCQFFNTIGKQLDESRRFRLVNDTHFKRLKELTAHPQLTPRLRFIVSDVLDLRANKWIPRREEIKAKTINKIHLEPGKNLRLHPGAAAGMRVGRGAGAGTAVGISPGGFSNRPGAGGMMCEVPGTRKMPGMPEMDNGNWEVSRTRNMRKDPVAQSPTPTKSIVTPVLPVAEKQPDPVLKINLDEVHRKTVSLLKEYFSVCIFDEALQCVEELKAPEYHSEVVKESIALGLEESPPMVEPVAKLLEFLFTKNVLTASDIGTGCLLYGSMLDDIAIDLPKAPHNFGEVMAKLVLLGCLDFNVVNEVLKKVEDSIFQRAIFDAMIKQYWCESFWSGSVGCTGSRGPSQPHASRASYGPFIKKGI